MKRVQSLVVAVLLIGTTCSCLGPTQSVREVHYTVQRLGKPLYIASKAGEAQVVTVVDPEAAGSGFGKVDATGMMLVDEPTWRVYKAAYEAQKGD